MSVKKTMNYIQQFSFSRIFWRWLGVLTIVKCVKQGSNFKECSRKVIFFFRVSWLKPGVFTCCTIVRQVTWSMQTLKPFIWLLSQHPQLQALT